MGNGLTINGLDVYCLTNREKRLQPKGGKFWCGYCDAQIISEWRKCSVCGKRNGVRRFRKC